MRREITNDDIKRGKDVCKINNVKYELHYVTQGYGENDLIFDSKKMTEWYEMAYLETAGEIDNGEN